MSIGFPSPEFDDAVAAVCHGRMSDDQARALNDLLRGDSAARDEYILRLELHSRLASQLDLFTSAATGENEAAAGGHFPFPFLGSESRGRSARVTRRRKIVWSLALAASLAVVAVAGWRLRPWAPEPSRDEAPVIAAV